MRRDVHKSLELLEEYHAELFRSTDTELKFSIEKVIGIFKTNLFNSLCDIQEFYDSVLLNKNLPQSEKVYETHRLAERWQQKRQTVGPGPSTYNYLDSTLTRNHPIPISSTSNLVNSRKVPSQSILSASNFLQTATTNRIIDEFGREWEVEEVLLDASQIGLGFSISGGRDRDPEPDYYIRVTDISPGGAVAHNSRIRVGDVILRVNETDCVDVNHQVAVEALQKAGPYVRLLIKRLKPQRSLSQSHLNEIHQQQQRSSANERQRAYSGTTGRSRSLHQLPQQLSPRQNATVSRLSNHSANATLPRSYTPQQPSTILTDLTKEPRFVTLFKTDNGLGFNIVGGEDCEPIYISHVLPGGTADLSGNVRKGDVMLRVNDTDLTGATHAQAAFALKSIIPNTYVRLLLHYRPKDYHLFEDKVIRLRNDLLRQQQQQQQQNYSYQ